MANTLRFKRGLVAGIPTGVAGEPLFTTDTFDLYIGNGTTNTRFQKYIASGTTLQYLRGDGTLATFPILTGFVPYTGATANVDLGTHTILAQNATIASNGSGNTATITHTSGSGIALNITKGGNGEGLYVNKTSGSGNAATIIGTLNATTLVKSGGLSTEYLKADGSVSTLTNPITGTGTTNYLPKFTGASTLGNSVIFEGTRSLGFNTASPVDFGAGTYNFHLHDNGIPVLQLTNSTTGQSSSVGMRLQANGNDLLFINSQATGTMRWNTNGAERMRLHATGNFHLGGTGDSGQRLQVTGDTLITGATSITNTLSVGNTSGGNISLNTGLTNGSNATPLFTDLNFLGNANGNRARIRSYDVSANSVDGILTFWTNSNLNSFTEKMRIDGNGNVGIGTTSLTGINLRISKNITGAVTGYGVLVDSQINSDATSAVNIFNSLPSTQAASFNIGSLIHFIANQGTQGAGNTISNQYGFLAQAGLTGASNNYGFFGNIPSGTNRYNFYAGGTALNYFNGNTIMGTLAADSGDKLQVNGTMKVTGASTFGGNITNTTNSFALSTNGSTNKCSLDFLNGVMDFYTGTAGYNKRLTIAATGEATFSSSVTTGGNILIGATASTIGAMNFIRTNTSPVASRITFGTDGTGYSFVIGKNQGGTVTDFINLNDSGNFGIGISPLYKLDVTGEARVSSAIAIGTTPDTNKPFKILKNINATVGINFENTSTSSLAFSAIQMGTDVTGGTAFTNLVYGSSGISEAGVFKPSGTSLVNTGAGGLNFLAVSQPIRFFTSSGNGTLRASITNDGDFTQFNGTNPAASTTDAFRMYSADVVAGNAAPHFRTENGAVIKIYQETTGVGNAIFSAGGGTGVLDDSTFDGYTLRQIVKALRNQGILA